MNIKIEEFKHIEKCIMVDTLGLCVKDVPNAKLSKSFSESNDNSTDKCESEWSKGGVVSKSGKQSFRVSSVKKSGDLLIEGSNAAHYQNHNIVSSSDVTMTAFSMLHAVKETYHLGLDLWRARNFIEGQDIRVSRIDTPIMMKVPPEIQKEALINAMALGGIRAGIDTSIYIQESVYFDQGSQICALKAYDKSAEMAQKRRKLPLTKGDDTNALLELANSTLRLEAVYRKKYLERYCKDENGLVTPAALTPTCLTHMLLELIKKYNFHGKLSFGLTPNDLYAIRSPYRDTVSHWQRGLNLLKMFNGNKNKLTAHQRVIKRDYSINIFAPSPWEIKIPIELGDIFRPENFVPVPSIIRSNPDLFYQRDMYKEYKEINDKIGCNGGINKHYIHPNTIDLYDGASFAHIDSIDDYYDRRRHALYATPIDFGS
jgi:hypothetical protein